MAIKYYGENFKVIRKMNSPMSIIIGIMDDGKSYAMKEDMLERFLEHGERSTWMMNNWVMLNEEIDKFTLSNSISNPLWNNFEIKKVGNSRAIGYYDGEIMCYFVHLGSIKKTGRDDLMMNTYWDEFNFLDTKTYNLQLQAYHLYLSRNLRIGHRFFLAGNATSMNTPILYDLGIFELTEEWTILNQMIEVDKGEVNELGEKIVEMQDTSKLGVVIHKWVRPKEELDEKYKDNDMMWLMKRSKFYEHAFENKFINDDMSNVVPLDVKDFRNATLLWTVPLDDITIDIYEFIEGFKDFWYIRINKKEHNDIRYALQEKDVKDGITYNRLISMKLARMLSKNMLYYDTIVSQSKLWTLLKKHF